MTINNIGTGGWGIKGIEIKSQDQSKVEGER
jgi:hypothetical protein